MSTRLVLPWLFGVLAILPAALMLDGTAPVACSELPNAFSRGVRTEQSETLSVVASHCEVVDATTGSRTDKTVVNWTGVITAAAALFGAWFMGAGMAGAVSRARATAAVVAAGAVAIVALAVFFA